MGNKMTKQNIRHAIKAELKNRGWSLYRLCQESGVSYQIMHPYLAGHKELSLPKLQKIMDVLDLSLQTNH